MASKAKVDRLVAECEDGDPDACCFLIEIAAKGAPWWVAAYAWRRLEELPEELFEDLDC